MHGRRGHAHTKLSILRLTECRIEVDNFPEILPVARNCSWKKESRNRLEFPRRLFTGSDLIRDIQHKKINIKATESGDVNFSRENIPLDKSLHAYLNLRSLKKIN
jgi:hypothetical protein